MNVLVKKIFVSLIFVFMSNYLFASTAHGKSQAAIVIVSTGDFYAITKTNEKRSLKRRSKIFVGDTLVTGKKGRGQVRFVDGAIISLRPETKLRIDNYQYGKKANENSVLTLIKGGFRTITGAIGKESYKVISSMATIGIRGTHYEAIIVDQQMYVALWDGGVTVKNNGGEIDLGLGASYDFAQITSKDDSPKGLSNPPAAILDGNQPAVSVNVSKQKSGNSKSSGQTASMSDEDTSAAVAVTESGTKETSIPVIAALPMLVSTEEIVDTLAVKDLNYIGIAAISGWFNADGSFRFIGGQSTSGATGNPYFTDNGLSPGDPGFSTTDALYALLRGDAVITNQGNAVIDAESRIDWGAWEATASSPATLNTDPNGSSTESDITSTIYWITMNPTENMPTTGAVNYSNVIAALGGGSAGDISGFYFNADVDFAAATITNGQMGFNTTTPNGSGITITRTWYVEFSGQPKGSVFDVAINKFTSNVDGGAIKGGIAAVFTGKNADAVAGGFGFQSETDANLYVNGVFAVKQ